MEVKIGGWGGDRCGWRGRGGDRQSMGLGLMVFMGFSGGGLYFYRVGIGRPPTPAYSMAKSYHFHLN